MASGKKEKDILSSAIYINTIHQNLSHSDTLRNEISTIENQIFQDQADIEGLENAVRDLDAQKENLIKQTKYQIAGLQLQIKDLESQKNYTSEKIKILEYSKDNVQKLQILKPHTDNAHPIKPNKTLNVMIAVLLGIFFMLCLSFLLEYIIKYTKPEDSVKNEK